MRYLSTSCLGPERPTSPHPPGFLRLVFLLLWVTQSYTEVVTGDSVCFPCCECQNGDSPC